MKFYEYTQNNSGGALHYDDKICHRLFIEADTVDEANEKALELGVYFDGVREGRDCGCCGDRWSEPYEATEFPYRYGTLNKVRAEADAKEFGITYESTTWKFAGSDEPEPDKYDLIFTKVEQYAQYLKKQYSFVSKGAQYDARIFYKDGTVAEI